MVNEAAIVKLAIGEQHLLYEQKCSVRPWQASARK